MKKRKQKFLFALVAALALAGIFGAGLLSLYKKSKFTIFQLEGEKTYAALVTAKDTAAPAPIKPIKPGRALRLPILMYHHVGAAPEGADKIRRDLTVSAQDFEAEIKWLKDTGYQTISLGDLNQYLLNKTKLPKKPVILTFDDGYSDVFETAVPILKKYGFAGTFGIITNFPGLAQGANTYASWQQITGAKQEGMEIICHTQNHFDGSSPKYTPAYIFQNLSGCQKNIADHLGVAEPFLIYPYGHYTDGYIRQAQKAGFVMGLTVHESSLVNLDDMMRTPRVRIHSHEDFEKFKKLLTE